MTPFASRLLPAALWAALAVGSAGAQPVVTRADVVAQLTTAQTATDFLLASEAGLPGLQALADRTGPAHTWDLTPFIWEAGVTATSVPVAPPVPGSEFEGMDAATHVVAYTEGDSTAYAFVRVTDDALDLLGLTAEVEDGGEAATAGLLFRPFDRAFPLPLTSTSEWTSTYGLAFIPALDGLETETTDSSAVVGWGTLVTPAGSAAVLQVRTKSVSTATFSIPGLPPTTQQDSSYTVAFVARGRAVATLFLDGQGRVQDASFSTLSGSTAGEERPRGGALTVSVVSENPTRRGAPVDVAFALPDAADTRLDVFDALGRRVFSRSDGVRTAGARRTLVPTAELPAGVYLIRLTAGASTGATRFTIVE